MLPSTEEIVSRVRDQPGLETRELAKQWKVGDEALAEFADRLFDLQRDGLVLRVPTVGWSLPGKGPYRIGALQVSQRGHGYVRTVGGTPEREEFFVRATRLGTAITGDRVLIKMAKAPGRGARSRSAEATLREATVVEIVDRSRKQLRGQFFAAKRAPARRVRRAPRGEGDTGQSGGFVRVSDRRNLPEVAIAPSDQSGARDGEKVLFRLLPPSKTDEGPRGEITVRVVDEGSYRSDLELLCAEFELPGEFPESVLEESESAKSLDSGVSWPDRVDLRDLRAFTIDPPDARDFDDAVSLEALPDGGLRLGVHIADVAHYVRPGSCLDVEAEKRGTSIYLPAHVIPMLPDRICNDLCSLRPDEDRLAKTVRMTFDRKGELRESEIFRSVIRSQRRFTYDEVLSVLEPATSSGADLPEDVAEYVELLRSMNDLRELLWRQRADRGALSLDIPKLQIDMDASGDVTGLSKDERDVAHSLIEEFMLAANEAVARFLAEKKLPVVARVHPPPDEERFDEFRKFLKAVGVEFRGESTPEGLQNLVAQLSDDPISPLIQLGLLRTMGRAEYAAKREYHFALATSDYCHFTSPIRRYPDLLIHQVLDEHFDGRLSRARRDSWRDRLPETLGQASQLERRAEDAEREMMRLRLIRYLEPMVGEEMEGHIAFVAPFGFFVRIEENLIEGLVHVASLGGDYYEYDGERLCLEGQRRKKRFSIGDPVRVQLTEVNADTREIGFRLVEKTEDRRRGKRR